VRKCSHAGPWPLCCAYSDTIDENNKIRLISPFIVGILMKMKHVTQGYTPTVLMPLSSRPRITIFESSMRYIKATDKYMRTIT